MKKKLTEITGLLKSEKLINDKRLIVFLVCLFIATSLWFLNALSKDYSTTINYPVKYVNAPDKKFMVNEPPSRLELKVNAHGFTLLRHKLNFAFSPIVLNITTITENIEANNGTYQINTNSLIRRISNQVSKELIITEIRPEYLQVRLDSLYTKSVPVKANISLDFKPQYNLRESVKIVPEKVNLTGPSSVISGIYSIETEKKQFTKLDADFERNLKLIHPNNVRVHPEKVNIIIPVEKFTEKEIKIPVTALNAPENTRLKLFPSEIKLTLLVGLSEFEEITAEAFKAVAYFDENNAGSELKVSIQSAPKNIQIVRYRPESVEYLIESNQ